MGVAKWRLFPWSKAWSLTALGLLWWGWAKALRPDWTINPQYHYGWGVPFFALYLWRERWLRRPAPSPPGVGWWFTFLMTALGLALLPIDLVQEANPDWRALLWARALTVTALTWLGVYWHGGGPWARHFGGVICFTLLAVPWPFFLERPVLQGLMRSVAAITVELLNWTGIAASQKGSLIELSTGVVGVSEACSGLRSLQSTLMIAVFLGEWFRLRPAPRCGLVALGVVCSLSLNLGRTYVLTWVWARSGAATFHHWHDPAGWILLLLAFLVLCWVANRLSRQAASMAADLPLNSSGTGRWPSGWASVGLVAWLAAVPWVTELWYWPGDRGQAARGVLAVRWPSEANAFRPVALPDETRSLLRFDEGFAAAWRDEASRNWQAFLFRWQAGRLSAALARSHNPETCLPAIGLRQVGAPDWVSFRVGTEELLVRAYLFETARRPLYVFFAVRETEARADAPRETVGPPDRLARLREAVAGRRPAGQQVLEVALQGADDPTAAGAMFQEFLRRHVSIERRVGAEDKP